MYYFIEESIMKDIWCYIRTYAYIFLSRKEAQGIIHKVSFKQRKQSYT